MAKVGQFSEKVVNFRSDFCPYLITQVSHV